MKIINVTNKNLSIRRKKLQNTVTLYDTILRVLHNTELTLSKLTCGMTIVADDGSTIKASKLKKAKHIAAHDNSIFEAPELEEVEVIEASSDSVIKAPKLKDVKVIKIYHGSNIEAEALKIVERIEVWGNTTINAPALAEAGTVRVFMSETTKFPALITIKNKLQLADKSTSYFPELVEVGTVHIFDYSSIFIPSLRTIKGALVIDTAQEMETEYKLLGLAPKNKWVISSRCSNRMLALKEKNRDELPWLLTSDVYRLFMIFYNNTIDAMIDVMKHEDADDRHFILSGLKMNRPFNFQENSEVLSGEKLCHVIMFFYEFAKSTGGFEWMELPFTDLISESDLKLRTIAFIMRGSDDDRKHAKKLFDKAKSCRQKLEEWTNNGHLLLPI